MAIIDKRLQEKIGEILLSPFYRISKLSYRPKTILSNTRLDENSFNSIEINNLRRKNKVQSSDNSKNISPIIYNINDGVVITDNTDSDCFITQKGELISEITFSYSKGKEVSSSQNNIFKNYYKIKPTTLIKGGVFSLLSGGGANTNYYHWLFDSLPRLKILSESGYKNNVNKYLTPNLKQNYKLATLNALNIDSGQIIDSIEYSNIKANNIIATTHPNHPSWAAVPQWICQFLRDSFLTSNNNIKVNKHIYISRKNAAIRRIINEDLLFAELKKLKFEMIFLENLTFQEQVDLFSSSKIIVSPHGAGLANLVFASPNTQIIEIFPPNSDSYIYRNISENQNLNYTKYNGYIDNKLNKDLDLHSDFLVDISMVRSLININN
ncbi:MAG: glycosyltransferase family 61 protein [Cellulophaga sp.]